MDVEMIINPINTAVGQHCNSNRRLLYYIAVNGTNERLYVGRLPALICKIPPSEWNFRAWCNAHYLLYWLVACHVLT